MTLTPKITSELYIKTGWGTAQDIEKALMYFKRAMEHGNEDARSNYTELLAHRASKQSGEE
jgi:TPR repeat protein